MLVDQDTRARIQRQPHTLINVSAPRARTDGREMIRGYHLARERATRGEPFVWLIDTNYFDWASQLQALILSNKATRGPYVLPFTQRLGLDDSQRAAAAASCHLVALGVSQMVQDAKTRFTVAMGGGSLRELERLTGWEGRRVLYVGDHLHADLREPRRGAGWATAAIIRELEAELEVAQTPAYARLHRRSREIDRMLARVPGLGLPGPQIGAVLDALFSRRTVHDFDAGGRVADAVVRRAVGAAIRAPNHGLTEPWRFRQLGPQTVRAVAALNAASIDDDAKAAAKRARWEAVPGWLVVTSALADGGAGTQREVEDRDATCCAIQNLCLALWAEGVGTKWTSGAVTRSAEFRALCGIGEDEAVVGVVWYGLASGGLGAVRESPRKLAVDDVLSTLP